MPKQIKPLTATQVKSLTPRENSYELNDGRGLQIRVNPTGSRTWLLKYSKPGSTKRTNFTLGTFPAMSLADARIAGDAARELIKKGIDPKADKDAKIKSNRTSKNNDPDFQRVTLQWWDVKKHDVSEGHALDILNSLKNCVWPDLGGIAIGEITAPIVIEALRPLEARGAYEKLRRVCQRINEVMTYAVNTGLIDHNRLSGIKSAFIKPEKKNLPALEPSELPLFLNDLMKADIRVITRNLILWQLHTMVRPSEAAGTCWEEIDMENRLWTIPPERMKKKRSHTVPLTDQTISLLTDLKEASGRSDYVFPSSLNNDKPFNSSTANVAIKRMGYKGRLVAHGLRSIASTTLNEQAFSPDLIESALAHLDKNEVRAAYNRSEYLERRSKMMQWWSNHIESALIKGLTSGSLSNAGLSLVG